ncbi:hypothetical protein BC940DRAFT_318843 [Gongronella butleri]|nr:hypothetical protein BC940DRAFT_318843 [Gongronella butleri]
MSSIDNLALYSEWGRMSIAKRVAAIGHAVGAKDSADRRQQAETLWDSDHPELRRLHADKEAFVRWITSLEKDRDIFHCALYAHQVARFEATETHTSRQLNAISRFGPLIGERAGDHSFLNDPEKIKAAASAKGKQMAAVHKLRRRAAPITVKGKKAIDLFLDAPVHVNSNHRINLRVIGNDKKARAVQNGIQLAKSVAEGDYLLHVDPDIDRRAVLLKHVDSTTDYVHDAKGNLIKITDTELLRPGRNVCLEVFKKTLARLGIPLHNSLLQAGQGRMDRVARLFVQKHCIRGANDFCTDFYTLLKTPAGHRPPHAKGRHFATALKELTDTLEMDPAEKLFWTSSKGQGLNRIRKELERLVGKISTQKTGGSNTNWKFPDYELPAAAEHENEDNDGTDT